jgi:predicted O-methyltransferase YrrM
MTITRRRESVTLQPRKYDTVGLPTRYFHPGELEALLHLFESVDAKVIVEFGVNTGRNPAAALRNMPGIERYVGIDVTRDYQTLMPVQRKEIPERPGELAAHDSRFELIVRKRGSFELTADDLPECDAVFIDADHSRDGVLNDYALAKAKVRPGGIIIFHDDNCLPVVQVTETLNEMCASGVQIVHVADTWLAYERIGKSDG